MGETDSETKKMIINKKEKDMNILNSHPYKYPLLFYSKIFIFSLGIPSSSSFSIVY